MCVNGALDKCAHISSVCGFPLNPFKNGSAQSINLVSFERAINLFSHKINLNFNRVFLCVFFVVYYLDISI